MTTPTALQTEALVDFIDPALAQRIVDRSMGVIDSNVNVINRQGVIIASGDRSRIGQNHEGALLVLAREAAVDITPRLAQQLDGALPGVNLPLRVGGVIVGCVGLTGSVRAMRPYAELVRIAAETMLEQGRLTHLAMRDARLREDLVLSIAKKHMSHQALTETATHLGIDLSVPRVAAIVEITADAGNASTTIEQRQALSLFLSRHDAALLIAPLSARLLILLLPAMIRKGRWSLEAQKEKAAALVERASQSLAMAVTLSLGRYFADAADISEACQTAMATLDVGKRIQPDHGLYFYEDLKLHVLLDALRSGWRGEEIAGPLRPLLHMPATEGLVQTLRAWFEHDMQRSRCAAALGIHRNTLDYRLKRIEEICQVKLSCTDQIMRLYLALQLHH